MARTLTEGGQTGSGAEIVPLIRGGTRLLLAVIWLVFAVAAATSVWLLLARATAQSQATAVSLEQYARRNIELGAFVAAEFAAYLDKRGGTAGLAGDAAATAELARLNRWLPEGTASLFALLDGSVAVSSSPLPAAPVNLSDRRWFRAHVAEGFGTYVGPAIMGRVINRLIYTYTASYVGPDGKLQGVIDLGIPSDSLVGIAADVSGMAVALVQHEGPLVAAAPFEQSWIGRPFGLPGPPPAAEATTVGEAFGTLSLASVRNLPDHGLYVIAALPLLGVLQPALWGIAGGLVLLGVLTLGIGNLSRIAQRKSREVEQALADNRVLFQEVHHRVKNNLQIVSSLIRLQTDRLPPEFRPLMEQTGVRVRAIAAVHEQIYRTGTPSVVQFDMFLRELAGQLSTSMLRRGGGIVLDLAPVQVGLNRAVPVALLAAEAITNAIKHGTAPEGGTITLRLAQEAAAKTNFLDVTDQGAGPPSEADAKDGVGHRIMTALARQIDGQWTLEAAPGGGARFRLAWPAEDTALTSRAALR